MSRVLLITVFCVAVLGLIYHPVESLAGKDITPRVVKGIQPVVEAKAAVKPAASQGRSLQKSGSLPHDVKVLTWADLAAEGGPEPGPLYVDGDILVAGSEFLDMAPSTASDTAGYLYCAYQVHDTSGVEIQISRSIDSGMTWHFLSRVWSGVDLTQPSIAVGEGNGERYLILAFVHGGCDLDVVRWTLDLLHADGSMLEHNAQGSLQSRIVTDAVEYWNWYPYVVYNSRGIDSWLLRFSRSTDYGATWSAPFTLHAYSGTPNPFYDAQGAHPDVEFGSGYLCVAFDDYPTGGDGSQRDLYFLESGDFGGSWSAPTAIGTSSLDEFAPRLAAVKFYPTHRTVVAGYTKLYGGSDFDVWYAYTTDGGGTWNTNYCLACASDRLEATCDLETSYDLGRIHMGFYYDGTIRYTWAPYDSPASWAAPEDVSDPGVAGLYWPWPSVVIDYTRPPEAQAGMAWTDGRTPDLEIYFDGPITTNAGVYGRDEVHPKTMEITCLPNPFTASTTVSFSLPRRGPVKAAVYDVSGRLVRPLADGALMEPGENRLTWDGLDSSGRCAGPGVYYVRVSAPDGIRASKVVVMK